MTIPLRKVNDSCTEKLGPNEYLLNIEKERIQYNIYEMLENIIAQLKQYYGPPAPPPTTDPFELILWSQVGYLSDNQTRAKAFDLLRTRVGLTPGQILAASESILSEITAVGGSIAFSDRAQRLRKTAIMTMDEWGGDLQRLLHEPFALAKKGLCRFPMIGEPGAEKILLFTRTYAVFALESNGLRVMVRVGYAQEQKNYEATYQAVKTVVQPELRPDFDWLIDAHQLLRLHGQTLCKRTSPLCGVCPINQACAYFKKNPKSLPLI